MAPIPASAHGTTAPTAKYRDATATPRSPVTGSIATIENVALAGIAGTRTSARRRMSRRMMASNGAGQSYRRSSFIRIPEGDFLMGSDEGQIDEQPVHRVWVDTFALSVY